MSLAVTEYGGNDPIADPSIEALDDLRACMPRVWTYPGFVLIFFLTTGYHQAHPAVLAWFGIVNLILSSGRMLYARFDTSMKAPWASKRAFAWVGSILLSGLIWGLFYSATILLFGFESQTFLIVTIAVVIVCSGATASLAPHLPALRTFAVFLLCPCIAADMFRGG